MTLLQRPRVVPVVATPEGIPPARRDRIGVHRIVHGDPVLLLLPRVEVVARAESVGTAAECDRRLFIDVDAVQPEAPRGDSRVADDLGEVTAGRAGVSGGHRVLTVQLGVAAADDRPVLGGPLLDGEDGDVPGEGVDCVDLHIRRRVVGEGQGRRAVAVVDDRGAAVGIGH